LIVSGGKKLVIPCECNRKPLTVVILEQLMGLYAYL